MKKSAKNEGELYKIGQRIGIKKSEIQATLKKRKRTIITGAVVIVALAFIANVCYLGTHYGGVSIEDFLSRFKILRYLFGWS